MRCQNCGAEIQEGFLFCRECGAKVISRQKRFCGQCGTELAEGVKFCPNCGAKASVEINNRKEGGTPSRETHSEIGGMIPAAKILSKSEGQAAAIADKITEKVEEIGKISKKADRKKKHNQADANITIEESGNTNKAAKKKWKGKNALIGIGILVLLFILIGTTGNKKSSPDSSSETATVPADTSELINMENVVDMTLPEAEEALRSAGFSNIASNVDTEADKTQWIVTGQSIAAGEPADPESEINLTCALQCKLYLDITSELNLMLNTYDITISLDGTEVGSVANGKGFTYLADVLSGEHQLEFCKSGGESPKATKEITVSGDMTYACDLAHGGSSIDIKNAQILDNIAGSELEVVSVTGMVLSEAMETLQNIGFSNLHAEPSNDIWDKDNWIVTGQGVPEGTVADKNEYIQLDCIALNDYFNTTYTGKNVNEILELADASGFAVTFEGTAGADVSAMDVDEKNDWIATSARKNSVEDKTAVVTIQYTGEVPESTALVPEKEEPAILATTPAESSKTTEKESSKPATTTAQSKTTEKESTKPVAVSNQSSKTTEKKYDVDKDLVVVQCDPDAKKKNMYTIAFAECDSSGNPTTIYTFKSIVNPHTMGDDFDVAGPLPLWFHVGATVHVKADLFGGYLSQSECTVTRATGTANNATTGSDQAARSNNEMPIMTGTSVNTVVEAAAAFGLKEKSDEDFGHGTRHKELTDSAGLDLSITYATATKEILCGSIVTSNSASPSSQEDFIKGMAGLLCPVEDAEAVTAWVRGNIGNAAETEIGGKIYEVGMGPTGNLLYYAGESNWEEWDAAQ